MGNSTHKVEVVPVHLEPHPNADRLSIVHIFGYSAVVRTSDWLEGQLGAYIPPDSLVDTSRPEFAWLANGTPIVRIKAKKFRGVVSFGLLIPAPAGAVEGQDVAGDLGVQHYEPLGPGTQGPSHGPSQEAEPAPPALAGLSKYDIDSLRRYAFILHPDERVIVTEKIHGTNSRYCWLNGRMWCGSRTEWKRYDKDNLWWRVLADDPLIEWFCRQHPGRVLYGEVYGCVQDLRYGCGQGEVRFAGFDVLSTDGTFLEAPVTRAILGQGLVRHVPILYDGPFISLEHIAQFAEGPSAMPGADHCREGCVVRPVRERWDEHIGRVILKLHGADYLTRKG